MKSFTLLCKVCSGVILSNMISQKIAVYLKSMHKEKVKGGWADLFHLCVVDSTHDQLQCASSVIK